MARIKIKCRTPDDRDKKLKLIEILSRKDIEISRIFNTNDEFVVLTLNEHNADNIFDTDTKHEFTHNDFTPIMPPDLKARKNVIIPRVDDLIYEKNVVDIGEEIIKENDWIKEDEIENIYKFPSSLTIKITFTLILIAKKCTEKGLKAFKISIPGHEIKLETYIPIQCCMRCYTLEQHYTNECLRSREYKICS